MKGVAKAVDELVSSGEAGPAGRPLGRELFIGFREAPPGPVNEHSAKEGGVRANRQDTVQLSCLPFNLQHFMEHVGLQKRAWFAGCKADFERHDAGQLSLDEP